jgi:hypothetical protein
MPRIRCHYIDCVFLEGGYCGASTVEIDPDEGCMTYTHVAEVGGEEEVNEEELEEIWEEEDDELYGSDEDEEEDEDAYAEDEEI